MEEEAFFLLCVLLLLLLWLALFASLGQAKTVALFRLRNPQQKNKKQTKKQNKDGEEVGWGCHAFLLPTVAQRGRGRGREEQDKTMRQ